MRQVRPGLPRIHQGALRLPAEVRGRQPLLRLDDRPRSTTGRAPTRNGESLHPEPSAGGTGHVLRGRGPDSRTSPRGPHQAASTYGQAETRAGHALGQGTAHAACAARAERRRSSGREPLGALTPTSAQRRVRRVARRARGAVERRRLLRMECDSDEASRSARQHGGGCWMDGLACNARPMMVSLRRRTGGSCCGTLRNEAPSIAATLLETLHGAG